jgi:pSer/pThr/pTyr-binding forkhead associated (FHA) protein
LPPDIPSAPATGTICSACQYLNLAGSFFCYSCGNYFAENGEKPPGNGAKPPEPIKTQLASKARMIIPGRREVILTGAPTFIERSSFDPTLPQDILMSISRQHILITCDNGTFYVQDFGRDGTGSTNHTKLNDVDIHHKGRQPLKNGDRIELARQSELTLIFKLT